MLGRVEEVVDSPAHPLLVVSRGSAPEIMIPFVSAAVPVVSVLEGYVVVDAGFLDDIAARR